ncbi:MAG: OpcA/G6PD domain-containing protein, partial [Terriglobales bacterium]
SELLEATLPPERAVSVVAPLLASDLPTVLLWRGGDLDLHGGERVEFLGWAGLAQRVLVDAHRLHISAGKLAALAQALPRGCSLNDFTWTRLTPWRQLLCQGLEVTGGSVHRIRRVTIAGDETQLAATLFAGWMADKLQWSPLARLDERELRLSRAAGGEVHVRFEGGSPYEALLRRLVVEADEDVVVAIEHRGTRVAMQMHRGGQVLGEWAGAAEGAELLRGETATLCEELSIGCADLIFRRALECGLEMQRCLESSAA